MGMANRRDGGLILIGLDDVSGRLQEKGLTNDQLKTWANLDDVTSSLAEFMDPMPDVTLATLESNGRMYVEVRVQEFDVNPVLCAKEHHDERNRMVLRRGGCYVRSHRQNATTELASQQEMRELLDLAIEKGVRRYLALSERVGLSTTPSAGSDAERFDEQLRDFR